MALKDIELRPISPVAGVEVIGLDMRDELPESTKQQLRDAWHKNAILLFRGQQLDEAQQLQVGTIFGEISDDGEYGEQNYVSNVIPDGLTPHGELAFHCDHSWSEHPLRGIMLYAIEVPPEGAGGETMFADVKRAWELLPAELQAKLRDLEIVHTYPDQTKHVAIPGPDPRPGAATAKHDLVMSHPVTGETLLFCSPRHFDRIVGWDHDAGIALAEELSRYINRPEVIYKHTWKPGDLVVWDNFRLQHARTNFDRKYRRHLRRTQIGEPARVPA
jgi:taurine dioxygenase